MKTFQTEQETFWAGQFGDDFTKDKRASPVASNIAMFSDVFKLTSKIDSVIEFGANTGVNLTAIRQLLPNAKLSAIEINPEAIRELEKIPQMKVYPGSILDFEVDTQRDLSLIKGVLIHINPDMLPKVYDLLYKSSNRYVCVCEYYSPSPVDVLYRGHKGKLFKRDFAGEMMERFPDLKLLGYAFMYRRDPQFPQDDMTWFLLEKTTPSSGASK